MGLFSTLLSAGATGGMSAIRQQLRHFSYNRYTSILFRASLKPQNADEARQIVRDQFSLARSKGFFTPQASVLKLIVGTEFGFNGYKKPGASDITADGSQRISPDLYAAALVEAQTILRTEPPGTLYISPTAMLYTGTTVGGKPGVENRGFAIASGADTEVLEHSKKNLSNRDNPGTDVTFVEGSGPKVYNIDDVVPGDRSTRAVLMVICLDYKKELAAGRVHFPICPSIIVCLSNNHPQGTPPFDCDVLVNDSADSSAFQPPLDSTRDLDEPSNQTGVWEVIKRDPFLSKFIKFLRGAENLAYPVVASAGLSRTITDQMLEDYCRSERVMSALPYIPDEDGRFVITPERPLPDAPTNTTLGKIIVASETDGATLLTGGIGRTETDALVKSAGDIVAALPWDFVHEQLAKRVDREVGTALETITDPFAQETAALLAKIDTPDLRNAIGKAAGDLIWESAGSDPGMDALVARLGTDAVRPLLDRVGTAPFVARITKSGQAWLPAAIAKSLTAKRAHASAEAADTLKQSVAEADGKVTDTKSELAANQNRLKEIEAELAKQPNAPELEAQRKALAAQVEHDVQTQTEAEKAREEAAADETAASDRAAEDGHEASQAAAHEDEAGKQAFEVE